MYGEHSYTEMKDECVLVQFERKRISYVTWLDTKYLCICMEIRKRQI